jgi:hypothetical protein
MALAMWPILWLLLADLSPPPAAAPGCLERVRLRVSASTELVLYRGCSDKKWRSADGRELPALKLELSKPSKLP